MSSSIFMITESGSLVPMDQEPFPKEDSFQELLERYPELLSGSEIDPDSPRRWILVEREPGIPDRAGGSTRWAADHIFLDQDGIPTFVEVKRAENDNVRRKVVAQILEYAANAISYWPPDVVRTRFEDRTRREGKEPTEEMLDRLGIDPSNLDRFWDNVETNLRNKKVRMLIVADKIPRELRQVIEFLNEQMNPASILALELRHFVWNDIKTLVPVVFGRTEHAAQEKATRPRLMAASLQELLARIEAAAGENAGQITRTIVEWAQENGFNVRPTSKNVYIGIRNEKGELVEPFSFDTDGKIWAQLGQIRSPFDTNESRVMVRERLSRIPGVELSKAEQYPTSPIVRLTADSVSGFEEFLSWVREGVVVRRDGPMPS